MKNLFHLTLVAFAAVHAASAGVVVGVQVLSATDTSTTIQISSQSSGTFEASRFPESLWNGIYIDYSSVPSISAATTGYADNTSSFISDNLQTNLGDTLKWIEYYEGTNFDRLGLVFHNALDQATSLVPGTSLVVELPTDTPLHAEDFEGLPVYWGSDNNYTEMNLLVGSTTAVVPEPATSAFFLGLSALGILAFVRRCRRSQSWL